MKPNSSAKPKRVTAKTSLVRAHRVTVECEVKRHDREDRQRPQPRPGRPHPPDGGKPCEFEGNEIERA